MIWHKTSPAQKPRRPIILHSLAGGPVDLQLIKHIAGCHMPSIASGSCDDLLLTIAFMQ